MTSGATTIEQRDEPMRLVPPESPRCVRRIAFLTTGVAVSMWSAALAQAEPASQQGPLPIAADSSVAPAASTSGAAQTGPIPEVARRLWHDLGCGCTDSDCSHQPLEGCQCPFATKQRDRILERVRALGFGTEKLDAATYATVRREYLAKYPISSQTNLESPWASWGRIAGGLVLALAAGAALIRIVERLRNRPTEPPQVRRFIGRPKRIKLKKRR